ncbi:HD domain-containing protein [Candidatus Marinimicrobia bacterium PRS2]|nr:HD domain-containing protein [Candidatus Marinimicrobia bacterium PRS2]
MSSISQLLKENNPHEDILAIAGSLGEKENIPTYIVGGYVRDTLLGKSCQDIDIMVEGDGVAFAKKLARELKVNVTVDYDKFGTAMIPYPDIEIEVASARKEKYHSDSRKPEVTSSTVEEDMSRRDFTINAISASLMPSSFGELYDPFGGIKDLQKGLIITPLDPDETFSDDPLRMLRAVRFAAQLQYDVAATALDSISRNIHRLEIVSWERIRDEVIKVLKTKKPSIAFYLMKETGLLTHVFPEMDIMSGVEIINGMGHKDVFTHTLQVVDNAAKLTDKMDIRFAALVHDIAKPQTKRFDNKKGWTFHGHDEIGRRMLKKIARRMKLSNNLRDYLMLLTKLHLRPIALAKKEITDSAVRRVMAEAGEYVDDLMILCRADITTKNPKKVSKYMGNFEKVEHLMQDVKLRDEMKAFQSPVRGKEIMKTFKLKPGRQVGQIKKAIEEAILDGEIPNEYEAAHEFMLKMKLT